MYAQILSTREDRPITARQCHVSVTRRVTRCGFDSISYGQTTTAYKESIKISKLVCDLMWQQRSWTDPISRVFVKDLVEGITNQ